jgi:hypothetical protein
MRIRAAGLRNLTLPGREAVLALAVLAVYAAVAPVAWCQDGRTGLAAAAVAAGFCWLGAGLALVAYRLPGDPKLAYVRLLAGMFPRMGIPLAAALVFRIRGGVLAEAGLLIYLVVFFLVTLALDTALGLPQPGRPERADRAS